MTSENAGAPIGVLFVDDEEGILKSLRRLFMDENCTVLTASSGQEGLGLLGSNNAIGVVVSDQRMPGMNGVDFLERVMEVRPDTLRVLITGYGDLDTVKDAINRGGAYRYVTKPWVNDEIIQTIREALARYGLINENRRLTAMVHAQNKELKNWNAELEQMVQKQTIDLTRQNDQLKSLLKRQKNTIRGVISSFSSLIELRDHRVRSHSRNVAELSLGIASSMKLPKNESECIFIAALLHDIGKIGVADAMLVKDESEMNDKDLIEYRMHPIRGQAALDVIDDLRDAGGLVRHHHERFDGKGYPDALSGEKIPMGARIIAVADYIDINLDVRNPNGGEILLEEIRSQLKEIFDPSIFNHIPGIARQFIKKHTAQGNAAEIEYLPADLKEGMVVSRDVKSGTGILLLSSGTTLSEKTIETLRRLYRIDPSKNGIFVWVNK